MTKYKGYNFILTPRGEVIRQDALYYCDALPQGVESVLARVVHEDRQGARSYGVSKIFVNALEKTYSLVHPMVVKKMGGMPLTGDGKVMTRYKLVDGKLQDMVVMYESNKALQDNKCMGCAQSYYPNRTADGTVEAF